jgi:hypothetical protein
LLRVEFREIKSSESHVSLFEQLNNEEAVRYQRSRLNNSL